MVERKETDRPNVIWIFGDQHRGQALGCAGDPNLYTPNLDRMACEGLQFPCALSGAPLCTPHRGCLLTSRYAHECAPDNGDPIPEGMPTISTVLRKHGYRTCYLGKWHLAGTENRRGGWKKLVPEFQRSDWDEWLGYDNNNKQWDCWVHGGSGDEFIHYRLDKYETDALTDMLISRLEGWAREQKEGSGKPFFSVLSVQPPHSPYAAPPEWMQRHNAGTVELRPNVPPVDWVRERARRELAGYYSQIENLDWNVGRVWETLQRTGLYENTVVMFFSDHGDMHGSQGRFNKTVPWEESIKVPCIIAGERVKYGSGGGRRDSLLNHVDLAPTTLGLCGLPVPEEMRGFDYSAFWTERARTLEGEPDSAYLQQCAPRSLPPWRGIITRDGWKYAAFNGAPWLMYNLNDDPYETMNVVHLSHYFEERRRLHRRLRQWIDDVDDGFDLPTLVEGRRYVTV